MRIVSVVESPRKVAERPTVKSNRLAKTAALTAYGGVCYLCGASQFNGLTLRLVRGRTQFALHNDGYRLYRQLRKAQYPAKARIRVACKAATCRDSHDVDLRHKQFRFDSPAKEKTATT